MPEPATAMADFDELPDMAAKRVTCEPQGRTGADRDRWPLWARIAAAPLIAVVFLVGLVTRPFKFLDRRGSKHGDHRGPEY